MLAHVDLTALAHVLLSALTHVDLTALAFCLTALTHLGLATLAFSLLFLAVHSTGFTICHFDYLIPYAEIFIRRLRLFFCLATNAV